MKFLHLIRKPNTSLDKMLGEKIDLIKISDIEYILSNIKLAHYLQLAAYYLLWPR